MRGIQKGRPHEMWIGFAKTENMRTSRKEGFIDKRGLLQNIWLLGIISWILQKKNRKMMFGIIVSLLMKKLIQVW